MRGLLSWIAKGFLSAAYWLGVLYVATGMFFGDRVIADGSIAASSPGLPPWLYGLAAVVVYAILSWAWDRRIAPDRAAGATARR